MARTPSVEAHEKVLEAAIQLFGERGIENTSMDAIAQLSGVSKATVYKHWKDKEALCIEVLCRGRVAPPEFHSGSLRQDLIDFMTYNSKTDRPESVMKIWPRIIGYAATNPNFARAIQEHVFGPRRARVARMLEEGAERGELPKNIDVNLAMDLLFGPLMHRRFSGSPPPPDLTERVVDSFLRGQNARGVGQDGILRAIGNRAGPLTP